MKEIDKLNITHIIEFKSKHMSYKKTVYNQLNKYNAFSGINFWIDLSYREFNTKDRPKIHINLILQTLPIDIVKNIIRDSVRRNCSKEFCNTILKEIKNE